jgi:hypothetical protein
MYVVEGYLSVEYVTICEHIFNIFLKDYYFYIIKKCVEVSHFKRKSADKVNSQPCVCPIV